MIDNNRYREEFCIPESSGVPTLEVIEMGVQIKKKKTYKIIFSAAAAFIAAMLLSNGIVYAATGQTWIASIFSFANGDEVRIIETENETAASFESSWDFDTYLSKENGRLFFDYNGIRKDITDLVSATEYYRYELSLEDGGKSVILAGGSCEEKWGWIELIFDLNGNYINNRSYIPADPMPDNPIGLEEWHDLAMHNEGVPCGNPELDNILK